MSNTEFEALEGRIARAREPVRADIIITSQGRPIRCARCGSPDFQFDVDVVSAPPEKENEK